MVGSVNFVYFCKKEWRFSCSRSAKVTDFGTNQKRVSNFLLVRQSNLGPILHHLGDIATFVYSWPTPPLFHPNFGVFPLHQITHVGLTLFGCEIISQECQPMWSRYLNVTDGWADRRTDNFREFIHCSLQHQILQRDLIETYEILMGKERINSHSLFQMAPESIQPEGIHWKLLFQDVTKPSGKCSSVSESVIVGTRCHNMWLKHRQSTRLRTDSTVI